MKGTREGHLQAECSPGRAVDLKMKENSEWLIRDIGAAVANLRYQRGLQTGRQQAHTCPLSSSSLLQYASAIPRVSLQSFPLRPANT